MNKIILMAALTLFLGSCARAGDMDEKAKPLGIDISSAEIISEEDDHGGFHGDGTTFIRLDCSGTDIYDQIRNGENWTPFPIDDTVKALVYGIEIREGDSLIGIGPYLSDEDNKPLIPEIKNGYYLLIDRQAEEDKASGADILHRASLNFTLGIYDSDTDMLYYFERDT